MQLRDRTVLLVGASGGIGEALVEGFRTAGARVVATCRNPSALAPRQGVDTVALDLEASDLAVQLSQIHAAHPAIDLVVHCAGKNRFAELEHVDDETLDGMIDVNLRSAMVVARHFVRGFRSQRQGGFVFIGSTFGSIGYPGYTAYCATKFGLRGFSEALRRELADTGVTVLYIAPRATTTAMNSDAVTALNRALHNRMDSPGQVADQVIRAIARDQRRRYLGWPETLFVYLNGILPRLVDLALGRQLPVIRRFLSGEGS